MRSVRMRDRVAMVASWILVAWIAPHAMAWHGQPDSHGEGVVVEQAEINLGRIPLGAPVKAVFRLVNRGEHAAIVWRARMSPSSYNPIDRVLKPGETMEFSISFRPQEAPGYLEDSRTFEIEGQPAIPVVAKAEASCGIELTTNVVRGEAEIAESVTVRATDGRPFRILHVTPEIVGRLPKESQIEHVLTIDEKQWRSYDELLCTGVRTDHPLGEYASIWIGPSAGSGERPVTAPAGGAGVFITPRSLNLGKIPTGQPTKYRTWLMSLADAPYVIRICLNDGWGPALFDRDVAAGEYVALDAPLGPIRFPGRYETSLRDTPHHQPGIHASIAVEAVSAVTIGPVADQIEGEPLRRVAVQSFDGRAFRILDVLPAMVGELPDDARSRFELKIDEEAWREFHEPDWLVLRTDHPEGEWAAAWIDADRVGELLPVSMPEYPAGVIVAPTEIDAGVAPTGSSPIGTAAIVNLGDEVRTVRRYKWSGSGSRHDKPDAPFKIGPHQMVMYEGGSLPSGTPWKRSRKLSIAVEGQRSIPICITGKFVSYITIEPGELDPKLHADGRIVLRSTDDVPFVIRGMYPPIIEEFSKEARVEHEVLIDWYWWRELGGHRKLMFNTDHPLTPRVYGEVAMWAVREARRARED